MTVITSDFEYVEGMNPWLAGAYAQYDVGQEHAIVITCGRDKEGLVVCDSRCGSESLWDALSLPRHLDVAVEWITVDITFSQDTVQVEMILTLLYLKKIVTTRINCMTEV
jgi:hypothetical protein